MKTVSLNQSFSEKMSLEAEKVAISIFGKAGSLLAKLGGDYSDLAVFVSALRGLYIIHQTHHWQAQGKNFYGDHLMFQRLYEPIPQEVDQVAEKLVAFGGVKLTNYFAQLNLTEDFMRQVTDSTKSTTDVSLFAEIVFSKMGELLLTRLAEARKTSKESARMANLRTPGLENLIEGILDLHESHIYLLSQRLS
jgi:DNA-binding ferritin-like protein